MFEKASRRKLKFNFNGVITTEDLWDLSLTNLNTLAVSLKKKLKTEDEFNFLGETSVEDEETALQFEIVYHIIKVKLKERDEKIEAVDKKAKRDKILEAIAKKQDEAFGEKSLEELQKDLAEINC